MRLSARHAVCLGLFAAFANVASAQTTLTIVHVNDTHSHLDAFGPKDADLNGTRGGLLKAASIIARLRTQEPNTLLLHAGDAFHGDFFFNLYLDVPELQMLSALGLDAMAVGNHEFDLGPLPLAGALAQAPAGFPLISANLDFGQCTPATCGDLAVRIGASLLKEVGGVKVGVFALTVPTDPTTRPAPVKILGAEDPAILVGIAAQQVAALRGQGAQVVVLLSHLGLAYDSAIAQNVPGIDFVVEGHKHDLFPEPLAIPNPGGTQTLVVSAGEFYEHVGRLRFTVSNGAVLFDDYELLRADAGVPPSPEFAPLVEQLKAGIVAHYGEDVYATPLATAARFLAKDYDPLRPQRDTAMGNLVTDALRDATGTEIALTAYGLVSEGIHKGPVVGADVFRSVSYGFDPQTRLGFHLATFRIKGSELLKGIEITLSFLGVADDFFLQFSGLRYTYDSRLPAGQRVLPGSVRVNGAPLDPERLYTVTVNEGVAWVLLNSPYLKLEIQDLAILPDFEYHVLRDFARRLGTLRYRPWGRILDVAARPSRRAN
jgi:5'-nucleotidase